MARIEVGFRMSDEAQCGQRNVNVPRIQCMIGSSIQSQNRDRLDSSYGIL